jgi:predicted dehydrogenase
VLVSAVGGAHEKSKHDAAMFLTLKYESGFFAHINVSWLSPMKMRRTVLSGSSRTILFDDMVADSKLTIFEAGVDEILRDEKSLLNYRLGDITMPKIPTSEPLKNEIAHFIACIKSNTQPLSSGSASLPIIKVLEAAELSNSQNGTAIRVDWSDV